MSRVSLIVTPRPPGAGACVLACSLVLTACSDLEVATETFTTESSGDAMTTDEPGTSAPVPTSGGDGPTSTSTTLEPTTATSDPPTDPTLGGDTTLETTTGDDTTVGVDDTTTTTTGGDTTTTGDDTTDTGEEPETGDVLVPLDPGDPIEPVVAECFTQEAVPNLSVPVPSAIVSVDFNGDGKLDIATKTYTNNQPALTGVSVSLGLGDGTFAPQTVFPTGSSGQFTLATADFNGDGAPDLVDIDRSTDRVGVLLNKGDGTFTTAFYPDTLDPDAVVTGDFDGDGHTDIAVIGKWTGECYVLLNDGDGTFTVGEPFVTGASSFVYGYPTKVIDLDGDGKQDLVISSQNTETIQILHGKGDGSFQAPIVLEVGAAPSSIEFADFDGDGDGDIVFGSGVSDGPAIGGVYVLSNLGGGQFGPAKVFKPYMVAGDNLATTAVDLNSDGHMDIVTLSEGHRMTLMLNKGDGTFKKGGEHQVGATPIEAVGADVNADGKVDLLVSNTGASVNVLLQNDNGSFGITAPLLHPEPGLLLLADLDGDAQKDVLSAGLNHIRVLHNAGGGEFQLKSDIAIPSSAKSRSLADLDKDGDLDLVYVSEGAIGVMLNQGDGTLVKPNLFPGTTLYIDPVIADFTGDGKLDVIASDNDSINLLRGVGDGTLMPSTDVLVGPYTLRMDTADFNGDGKPDLVLGASEVDKGVHVLLNTGNGSFTDSVVFKPLDTSAVLPFVADLDNDGKPDLAVTHGTTMHVLHNPGDGKLVADGVYPLALDNGKDLMPADLDGDGFVDIVAPDDAVGIVSVSINQGDGKFQVAKRYRTFTSGPKLLLIDLNGDGKLDLAASRFNFSTLINNGDGSFQTAISFPSPLLNSMAGADLDGDGKGDVLASSSDGVLIMRSNCP